MNSRQPYAPEIDTGKIAYNLLNEAMPLGEQVTFEETYHWIERECFRVDKSDLKGALYRAKAAGFLDYYNRNSGGYAFWTRISEIPPMEEPQPDPNIAFIEKRIGLMGNSTVEGRTMRVSIPAAPWEVAS